MGIIDSYNILVNLMGIIECLVTNLKFKLYIENNYLLYMLIILKIVFVL